MKTRRKLYALASAITLLAVTIASAQTSKNNKTGNARSSYAGLLSASKLQGANVYTLQNESVGEINEVLLDPASGRIRFAVVGVGGFIGLGETNVAVPWSAFHISREGDDVRYVIDTTKEKLEKAPRVEGKNYDRLYSQKDAEPTFVYWGVTWYDLEPVASPAPSPSPASGASPGVRASATPMASPAVGSKVAPNAGSRMGASVTPSASVSVSPKAMMNATPTPSPSPAR